MLKMNIFLSVLVAASWLVVPTALAATVSNSGAETITVTVTENGDRRDVDIAAGAVVNLCPAGCFISFPSGDILALKGGERVVVENGVGRIAQ
ncbi:MAG: hypothetical protein OXR62_13545 [Ahrensia sp.]|nr:hypothetical protein [Ahrensia sp.]